MVKKTKAFKLEIKEDIGFLYFDLPDSKVNILKSNVLSELESVIEGIAKNDQIRTLIFLSNKNNNFIAGADINEIQALDSKTSALNKVKEGQRILSLISKLKCDTICYIDGTTMGGGTELALCFDYRVSSKSEKIKIALPEVNLGIIPGFGGTQRLPKLVGLINSLPMILTGKAINYKKAYKIGFTDSFFPNEYKEEKLLAFAKDIRDKTKSDKIIKRRNKALINKIKLFDNIILNKAKKNVIAKTSGHYPAPLKALEVLKKSYRTSINQGLDIELNGFADLIESDITKNLINLYFVNESLKKDNKTKDSVIEIKKTATLGAGIMGGGIAWFLTKCNYPVRIKDLNYAAIALGIKQIDQIYNQLKKIKKYNSIEITEKKDLVTYATNYKGFDKIDLVVEAIIEDIEIKKKSFTELEKHLKDEAIVASNTSSLSITEMAKAFKKPERFIGMHFFNPVNRMPLVEVIPHKNTDQKAIDTIVAICYKAGKTPIIVKDSPGFLVNRILLPYLNEAGYLLDEIGDIEKIDDAITAFGMPMGPLTLADNVGIDVGYKVAKILENNFGERMKVSPLIDKIYNDLKLLGKKSGEGFYFYNNKQNTVNEKITRICKSNKNYSNSLIVNRLILMMINEAAKCLEENIVANVEHLDMAMIMGTGFPAFRGGLLKYADSKGIDNIINELESFNRDISNRYKPAELLLKMQKNKEKFYSNKTKN
ncbi:MAG: enoyl-CoA hydratase/isomerase family protein [Rickettsiales bacterium]|nr:enoyl-CoA hydratase/isomerase family protein [Rickettsiales bacterium]